MVWAPPRAHDDGVARLLVLWSRPHHLTPLEAERWVRGEVRAVVAHDAICSARLSRLEPASPRHGADWQWLLELEIAEPVHDYVESGPCAEWLGDLRLLGMRAQVVVVADTIELETR